MTDESIAAEPSRADRVEWFLRDLLAGQKDRGFLPPAYAETLRSLRPFNLRSPEEMFASPEALRASSGSMSEREHELEAAVESAMEFIEHFAGLNDGRPNSAMTLMESLRAALSPSGPMISLDAVAAEPRSPLQDQSTRNTEGLLKLARFGSLMLSKHRNDGYPGDIDGGDAQAASEAAGVIEQRNVSAPCSEHCTCAEFFDSDEWPIQCYFIPDDVREARAALADQSDFRGLKRDEGPTADAATGTGNTQGTEP